jgi:hypothetical protein
MTQKKSFVFLDCQYHILTQFGESAPSELDFGLQMNLENTSSWTEKISNYRKLISEGNNATTDLLFDGFEYSQAPSYFRNVAKRISDGGDKRTSVISGNVVQVSLPSATYTANVTEAQNRALAAFYAHLNAVDTSFKGMVFAGEFVQTLSMLRHPFRTLRRGISDYLDYVGNVGRRLPRQMRPSFVRRTWLEYSYGWAPLLADCGNAVDAFYAARIVHPIFEMVRGRGSSSVLVADNASFLSTPNGQFCAGRVRETSEAEVKFYGIYHSTGSGLGRDSTRWGFRPSEFIPTIYELIPYSFLVDYFTNVGKVIESWSYRAIGARWQAQTVVKNNVREYGAFQTTYTQPYGPTYSYENQANPGSAKIVRRTIHRTKNAGFPLPSFDVKVPGKWYQWVNIAALSANHRKASSLLQS